MFLIQQTQLLELIFLHTIGCVYARETAQELGKKKSPLPRATALAKWARNKDISASQTIAAKGK